MDIGALLTTAGNLMLTGMVGVFVFLSILIGAVTLMSNLVTRFSEPDVATPVKSPSFKSQGVPNEHIAAISAAIASSTNQIINKGHTHG
ncbi:OadG family transporter subunit [Pseudoalteromonas sp. B193]